MATETEEPHRGMAVSVRGLRLDGPRGTVYRDIETDAAPGSLLVVDGPSGSGRTCLLLTLTGRMKPGGGHAEVGGHRLPRRAAAVRRHSALAHVPGVTDLDPSLSVAEHLRERVLLQRRFGGPPRALLRPRRERTAAARERLDAALAAAGLDLETLPKGPRTHVRDLERLEAFRLGIALTLIGEPLLLGVDDVGLKLPDDERAQAWSLLRSVAAAGRTVLAVGTPPESADDGVPVVRIRTGTAPPDPADDLAGTDTAEETDEPKEAEETGGETRTERTDGTADEADPPDPADPLTDRERQEAV